MTDLLFVGSYAPADQPGIFAFDFDPRCGALAERGAFAGVANPSFLALHPSGRFLYAVSEEAPGAVWAFAIEREPLGLRPLGSQPSGGDGPCHLLIDPAGRRLFVANYGSGSLVALPIGQDGALGAAVAQVQHTGRGAQPGRQDGPHAHSSILDPAGRHLIVADLGIDRLMIYRVDGASGALERHGEAATRPGAGPRHLHFHPAGRLLYVVNELDNTLGLYRYDPDSGALGELQVVGTLPPGAPESSAADIHLAADGSRLYLSNRGHNSIAVFAIDAEGRPERLATPGCGGDWPRHFALAPGGDWIVVANERSGRIDVLPLRPGGPEIGPSAAQAAVPKASCVVFC